MHHSIRELTPEEFPEALTRIPDAPKQLYVRGNLPDPTLKLLLVVGSRKHSSYGKDVCEKLIHDLKGYPVGIISGLAYGIDAVAHKAALRTGLYTLSVPGSGLHDDVIYPATHLSLAQQIVKQGGGLLSEFDPDFKATQWSFPQRNRIMAGLADVVLIIEAGEQSGTLITARLGLEYNKSVCVVPAPINSPHGIGSNKLLRDGAVPILSAQDILLELGITSEKETVTTFEGTEEEMRVWHALGEMKTADQLAEELDMPVHTLNAIISLLELKGAISRTDITLARK